MLIPAASSNVGLAAIQTVRRVGAVPVALTRTSVKAKALRDAGAAHVIATQEQDIAAEVNQLTNGKGAEVVFDPVGGPAFAKLVEATAPGGTIVVYGGLGGPIASLPVMPLLGRRLSSSALACHPRRVTTRSSRRSGSSSATASPLGNSNRRSPRSFALTRSSRPTATWRAVSRSERSS